jgi:hypothetical protein
MLTGPEELGWRDALFNIFTYQEFYDLLRYRLNDRLDRYTSSFKSFEEVIGDVVGAYSRREMEGSLIAAAVEVRPGNAALLRLASTKQAAAAPDAADLERLIRDTNAFLDFSTWLDKAGQLQVRVCRIEIAAQGGGMVYGTGFLVAPDMVMTNWHVVRGILAEEDRDVSYTGPRALASSLTCRFDYKVLANGLKSQGTIFKLAPDWRVALSPNNPPGRDPRTDELDFAILRLREAAGSRPVGDAAGKGIPGDPRGWIQLPPPTAQRHDFQPQSPLFLIEHPEGKPIKLALDTNAVLSVAADRTRVKYSTNTEPGSSGAPCFDQNWNLVALHHAGDPNFAAGHAPAFNQGIPIDTIASYLAAHGVAGFG